jgi:glycosyltransferase involved in cell wall biosynthesis
MLRDIFYHNKWTYQKNKKTTLITTIGGTTYKGLETIFNTLSIIILKLNINIEWKIIGIDNNHEIVKIMKRFTKVNVSSLPINFLGIKNAKELITEMLNSDIFIHPSHIDNSPNSVCEAMILGMPVIATYAGGTGSLLIDQKEGVLIQDGDPYAMAGAIIELIENIELAKKYGKNARKRAMKRHNKEKIVNKLVQIYRDINSKNK